MLDTVEESVRPISDKMRHAIPGDEAAAIEGANVAGDEAARLIEGYERDLGIWFGVENAVAVSSGGAAISVALAALGVGPGDEVVLPPTCPLCTVYPIMELGATPVFCDTELDGFGLSRTDLLSVVTVRTRAVIEVPMWGYPTDVRALSSLCAEMAVPLVLDLAHSHGSMLMDRSLAAFGTISCFSTHDRKPLSTGEGGFLLTDDDELSGRCRGYTRFGNLDGRNLGVNFKLSPIQAALGRHRLKSLASQIARRRSNARTIRKAVEGTECSELELIAGSVPNYYAFLIRLPQHSAKSIIDHFDKLGIPSDIKRYGCRPLYQFPAVSAFVRSCPNSEMLINSVTTIPVHPDLSDAELDRLVSAIRKARP